MGHFKDLAIALTNAGIDPETATIAQLSRPFPNESPATRAHRLAAKAHASGCIVIEITTNERYTTKVGVTSASVSGLVYIVDLDDFSCTCEARGSICCHRSLVLAHFGCLPDPDMHAEHSTAIDAARRQIEVSAA